jgi:hypothetical protein
VNCVLSLITCLYSTLVASHFGCFLVLMIQPEPSTASLLAMGVVVMGIRRRR